MGSATGLDGGALVLSLVQCSMMRHWGWMVVLLCSLLVLTQFQCIVGIVWILSAAGEDVSGSVVLSGTASIGSTTVPALVELMVNHYTYGTFVLHVAMIQLRCTVML